MTSTLLCIGLGYCAQHYVSEFGGRFERIIGTARERERIVRLSSAHPRASGDPEPQARPFKEPGPRLRADERNVEVIEFDGRTASSELRAALAAADALLITAAPDEHGDPVLSVLHADVAAAPRLTTIVYLSTVGVYGNHDGGWIDETTTTRPVSARSRERVEAEEAWRALATGRGIPVAILRLAGIYGPGQNALVNVRAGRARRIDKPGQVFNRIHVADIAQAIDAAFARRADGIFNVADDEPSGPGDPIVFAADLVGVAPPPEIPFAQAEKTMTPMAVSFYGESKRVKNDKLKAVLGVRLRYPTYREGLRALHAEMKDDARD